MNIHLPAILGFTRYQGFDPSPYIYHIESPEYHQNIEDDVGQRLGAQHWQWHLSACHRWTPVGTWKTQRKVSISWMAQKNPPDSLQKKHEKWRFLAKIICFYGPSIPWLCNKLPEGVHWRIAPANRSETRVVSPRSPWKCQGAWIETKL